MKKKVLIFFLFISLADCGIKGKEKNPYKNAIEAIKKDDNRSFISNIELIDSIDSLIAIDSIHSYSLLGLACLYNNKGAIDKLLELGANPKKVCADDIYFYDALYVAVSTQNLDLTQFFVRKGANVNATYNENGLCPLTLSCRYNHIDVTRFLLKNKANVNGVGDSGGDYIEYPLMIAIEKKNEKLVKLLLEYGAKTDIKNELGQTPIEFSKSRNYKNIVELLNNNIDRELSLWTGMYTYESEEDMSYSLTISPSNSIFEVIGMQMAYRLSCYISAIEKNKIIFNIEKVLDGNIPSEHLERRFIELTKQENQYFIKINYSAMLSDKFEVTRHP